MILSSLKKGRSAKTGLRNECDWARFFIHPIHYPKTHTHVFKCAHLNTNWWKTNIANFDPNYNCISDFLLNTKHLSILTACWCMQEQFCSQPWHLNSRESPQRSMKWYWICNGVSTEYCPAYLFFFFLVYFILSKAYRRNLLLLSWYQSMTIALLMYYNKISQRCIELVDCNISADQWLAKREWSNARQLLQLENFQRFHTLNS